jgi:small subunit ribosomal protein S1
LLAAEQKKAHDAFLKELTADQVHTGRVTRLMPYGAFVELIPGLEGMVHISELSWSRLEKPDDAVSPNDRISVKVLRIDPGPKGPKIALSLKQVDGDPWQRIPDDIRVGAKIEGKVTRCANFGAFVEIKPGIEGLVHISELSFTQRVNRVEDVVQPGQSVIVVIKEIDTDKRRISLSLRDAQGDPWAEVIEKYQPEQQVQGVVEKVEKFGVFIQLSPGIVGLLPQSVIQSAGTLSIDKLKAGQSLDVVVGQINTAERKISLKLGQGESGDAWQTYAKESPNESSLGSLAEKLSQALKNKK